MINILLAQREEPLGSFKGLGPLGSPTEGTATTLFASVLSSVIGFMTIIGALWFLFQVIISGYNWLSAGGDKQKIAEAQSKLTNAIIGLIVVVAAIFVVRLVTDLLGIPDVLDPAGIIDQLKPGLGPQ